MFIKKEIVTNLREENEDLIERLRDKNQYTIELVSRINKAIEVIHTQMKNNPDNKDNLKIIKNCLTKGYCNVIDLKKEN